MLSSDGGLPTSTRMHCYFRLSKRGFLEVIFQLFDIDMTVGSGRFSGLGSYVSQWHSNKFNSRHCSQSCGSGQQGRVFWPICDDQTTPALTQRRNGSHSWCASSSSRSKYNFITRSFLNLAHVLGILTFFSLQDPFSFS